MAFDLRAIRGQFPILRRKLRTADGRLRPICYMDHAASTHPPAPVLQAVTEFCSDHYANVHRGRHTLSDEASDAFEQAAETLAGFVGAKPESQPVVLTANTTQALDLCAHLVEKERGATCVTLGEHHSNDLPHRLRGRIVRARTDAEGRLDLDSVEKALSARWPRRVKLLAVTGASNVTGLMPPIHKLARLAHDHGARILVDAAQLYAHHPIDVKAPDHPEHIDFLAAAGHKAYAPFGSAFLLAPREALDKAPPYVPGGGTVEWVTEDEAMYKTGPDRHQPGTPNIVGAIAFAAATRWLEDIGMDNVREHEERLVYRALRHFDGFDPGRIRLLGPTGSGAAGDKVGVFAFTVAGLDHGEVSLLLDRRFGIATRNGCFCAQPLINHLLKLGKRPAWTRKRAKGEPVDPPGATRASFGIYNTEAEVDLLKEALQAVSRGDWKPPVVRPGKAERLVEAS